MFVGAVALRYQHHTTGCGVDNGVPQPPQTSQSPLTNLLPMPVCYYLVTYLADIIAVCIICTSISQFMCIL